MSKSITKEPENIYLRCTFSLVFATLTLSVFGNVMMLLLGCYQVPWVLRSGSGPVSRQQSWKKERKRVVAAFEIHSRLSFPLKLSTILLGKPRGIFPSTFTLTLTEKGRKETGIYALLFSCCSLTLHTEAKFVFSVRLMNFCIFCIILAWKFTFVNLASFPQKINFWAKNRLLS